MKKNFSNRFGQFYWKSFNREIGKSRISRKRPLFIIIL